MLPGQLSLFDYRPHGKTHDPQGRYNNSEKGRARNRRYRTGETWAKYRISEARRIRQRRNHLKFQYGITQEEWDRKFESQGFACDICRAVEHGGRGWHTDHCHKSGPVRGILCHKCNLGIGNFKDSITLINRAAEYLKKYAATDSYGGVQQI